MKTKRVVIGNWKQNPLTVLRAQALVQEIKKAARAAPEVEVVVAPPVLFIPELAKRVRGSSVALGAQNVSAIRDGACTGEVGATMVKHYGVTYALVGHSERRALGESSELVVARVAASLKAGLKTVLCVGERERHSDGAYMHVVREEVMSVCGMLTERDMGKLLIAYEPVWAIGKSADRAIAPADLLEMVLYIRKLVTEHFNRKVGAKLRVLYGGAVTSENAAAFVREGGVDGLLVGGASLNPTSFGDILTSVRTI